MKKIEKILQKEQLEKEDLVYLLSLEDDDEIELLRQKAEKVLFDFVGNKVFYRGLIEFSNICTSDCFYCGIRKSNAKPSRYSLSEEEIIEQAKQCADLGYGSIVLQSGERSDEKFVSFVEKTVKKIKESSISEKLPNGLGITLCVGEQSEENYRRLYNAGAHRYLLRIEATNPTLFEKIHPPSQKYETRIQALKALKKVGFQVGTGVMIGLPEQSYEDLAGDILFFKEMDIDMLGMGPYLVHNETPFAEYSDYYEKNKEKIYKLGLKMIALCRIFLKDLNIASTTALEAMHECGREDGLSFGANVIMPQLTPIYRRKEYLLYEGKPCMELSAEEFNLSISNKIASIGRVVGRDLWGDSKHALKKTESKRESK